MEHKDYIEDLIIKNLQGLNDNEPPEGHAERFEARLKQLDKRRKFISLQVVWKVAAAAVFVFLVVNQAIIWLSPGSSPLAPDERQGALTLASVSAEYEEVEFYYTNAIHVGLTQWEKLVEQDMISAEEQKMMEQELEEFEQVFQKLQGDLSVSPNDERVINAMLEYYQTKLSLINMIMEKLLEVKQKKNLSYESEN
jgi:hypothetical protein